ncbi:hypothetical protein N24_2628 [Corynebacterium suranareeae]|uniref:Uncharacterized protein n=1 Tax=Corynebacterium suranareeae TaxID=2506452 RepID=A0A160PQE0_9CORY|nr:hypothetical protein N24_0931 [Corynebacterium suranareeae]BAU96890.1 hypothetical protein N24_2628 [Corynebacterium suranareeae]
MPGGGSPKLSITVNNKTIVGMIIVWVVLFPVKGRNPHTSLFILIMPVTPSFFWPCFGVVGGGVVVFVRCWAFHKP